MRIIGVDSGAEGGLAELTVSDGTPAVTRVAKLEWRDLGKAHTVLDTRAVRAFIDTDAAGNPLGTPALVVLEQVNYRPGDAARAFGLMRLVEGYAKVLGACEVLYPHLTVTARAWQDRVVGKVAHDPLPAKPAKGEKLTPADAAAAKRWAAAAARARTARTKRAVLAAVQRLYPGAQLVLPRCRVPHEGVVDAVALAHYGYLQLLGQLHAK